MEQIKHSELSRRLGIDAEGALRWQTSDGTSYAVVGPGDRIFSIDLSSATESTMPYAVNDYTQAPLSHNEPAEAEEYNAMAAKPTLSHKLTAIAGVVMLAVLMLGLTVLNACQRKGYTQSTPTRHTRPAWKRTSLLSTDPEQANPTRL